MIRVSQIYSDDPNYLMARNDYVGKCIKSDFFLPVVDNDYFEEYKKLDNYKMIFKYSDFYNDEKYYAVETYKALTPQACCYRPYESFGYHCTKDGVALCEDGDIFNNCDISNTGENLKETHYATIFDARDQCFWG